MLRVPPGVEVVGSSAALSMSASDGLLRYSLQVGHHQNLKVVSDPDNVLGDHIGNGIWTAAHELVLFLAHRPQFLKERCVLELGSGLGLVGQVREGILPHPAWFVQHVQMRFKRQSGIAPLPTAY